MTSIATLKDYYRTTYPDYYAANSLQIDDVVTTLQNTYKQSFFPEQQANWDTHANNVGHRYSPGCFRCHDGKHLNDKQEAIRLECNLCHNVPVVVGPDKFVANIEISRGPEPDTHLSPNWIAMHYQGFQSDLRGLSYDPECGWHRQQFFLLQQRLPRQHLVVCRLGCARLAADRSAAAAAHANACAYSSGYTHAGDDCGCTGRQRQADLQRHYRCDLPGQVQRLPQ